MVAKAIPQVPRRVTAACLLMAVAAALAGAPGARAECVANPEHPFDASYDSGEPGWVDLGACKRCDAQGGACLECYSAHGLAANGTCVRCSDSRCTSCDGSPDVCLTCNFDWEGEAAVGSYADKSGKCQDCPLEGCMECQNVTGACTRCGTGNGLVGGRCVACKDSRCLSCDGSPAKCTECSSGFYAADGKCQACPKGCDACTDAKTCTECSYTVEGESERGLWLDPQTSQCVPCVPGCLRCPGGVDTCEACGTGFTNVTEGLCAACTQEHCTTCRPGEPDWCETCATFNAAAELQWGADPATGACVDCRAEHCASCQSNADVCDWCKDGYWIDLKKPDVCTPCTPPCTRCARDGDTGQESCDQCATGWTYSYEKETCVQDKPSKG